MDANYYNSFSAISKIKIELLQKFYSNPEVIEKLCDIIRENNSYISSMNYIQSNNSIQIQLRKVYLKKFENCNDSMEFYRVFDSILRQLFNHYESHLTDIFKGDANLIQNLHNNTCMFYVITRLSSNNSLILYL